MKATEALALKREVMSLSKIRSKFLRNIKASQIIAQIRRIEERDAVRAATV